MAISSQEARLSARVCNMLAVIESLLESDLADQRRLEAVLEITRATKEDANIVADILNRD